LSLGCGFKQATQASHGGTRACAQGGPLIGRPGENGPAPRRDRTLKGIVRRHGGRNFHDFAKSSECELRGCASAGPGNKLGSEPEALFATRQVKSSLGFGIENPGFPIPKP
jgi:hypothetical protein